MSPHMPPDVPEQANGTGTSSTLVENHKGSKASNKKTKRQLEYTAFLEECKTVTKTSADAVDTGTELLSLLQNFCQNKFVHERQKIEALTDEQDNPDDDKQM